MLITMAVGTQHSHTAGKRHTMEQSGGAYSSGLCGVEWHTTNFRWLLEDTGGQLGHRLPPYSLEHNTPKFSFNILNAFYSTRVQYNVESTGSCLLRNGENTGFSPGAKLINIPLESS